MWKYLAEETNGEELRKKKLYFYDIIPNRIEYITNAFISSGIGYNQQEK